MVPAGDGSPRVEAVESFCIGRGIELVVDVSKGSFSEYKGTTGLYWMDQGMAPIFSICLILRASVDFMMCHQPTHRWAQ